ncbi:ATP-binding protein [Horticoccus sp. 23ND18S-11]|uniref:ATP-binding protein n=1 Tax=Horticoccus sp. 23ND18S-11 TaxID=3391832 RepID=UPI0039C8E5CE
MSKPSLTQLALAAVAHRAGLAPDPAPPEAAFLANQARDLPTDPAALATIIRETLRKPAAADAPLARLAREWHLTLAETLSLALANAVEVDLMVGRALAYLQAPIGGSRPTLGLLAEAFGRLDDGRPLTPPKLAHRPVFQSGALALLQESAALPERPIALPLALCVALAGDEVAWPGTSLDVPDTSLALPESVEARCRQHAAALGQPGAAALVLRTAAPDEARAAATAIARALKKRPCFIEQPVSGGVAAWLLLRDLVPVFVVDVGPGETKAVPAIPLYHGPLLVVTGIDGTIDVPGRELMHWSLPLPTFEERAALWRRALPDGAAAGELARSHRLGTARIAQLGKLAAHRAHLDGGARPDAATVRAVSRSGEGAGLDALAQFVPEPIADDALVLSPELRAELEALLARCHHRDGLTAKLGAAAAARYTAGVRALFVGPSGTGKTLAAGWLATRLGLPLYRVDLSAINSKYIGETEKNLARLLARAERTEAVLLFDEADSLFGKRTEIRDSNDRFANTQTNYLLQRIESFDSIALLTSNSRGRFDTAFSRRLDVIIEFPAPGPAERRALWQTHLGDGHALSMQELNLIAGQCDFAGGQIRNVVLAAAVAARAEGRAIDYTHLTRALQGEYRKAGRTVPPALVSARADSPPR